MLILARQEQAVARAYSLYQERLLTYVNNLLPARDWDMAEDLAQDVWLTVWETAVFTDVQMDSHAGLPGFLARTARTAVRHRYRAEDEILVGFRGDEDVLADQPMATTAQNERVTALSFTIAHGSPATWSAADFEAQQHLAAIDAFDDELVEPVVELPVSFVPALAQFPQAA